MNNKVQIDIVVIPEYVRMIDSVQREPTTTLSHWQLIKVRDQDGKFSRNLVGRADGAGRVSTDIVSLDIVQLRATTQSGRVYVLGKPGRDSDAVWVFAKWLKTYQSTQHADQTRALLRLRARKMAQT
jgi:hypothetical protein